MEGKKLEKILGISQIGVGILKIVCASALEATTNSNKIHNFGKYLCASGFVDLGAGFTRMKIEEYNPEQTNVPLIEYQIYDTIIKPFIISSYNNIKDKIKPN